MRSHILIRLFLLGVALPSLVACESTKEELGLTRRVPDAFAVTPRAPLEMPPEYYLRPPEPGAARPQETAPVVQAEQAVWGTKTPAVKSSQKIAGTSKGEADLLRAAGAQTADPTIRQVLDTETQDIAAQEKSTVKRIFNFGGTPNSRIDGPAQVVDAPAEAARLKRNQETGQPVTEGVTPSTKK